MRESNVESRYTARRFVSDCIAAITVTVLVLPQGMAYAIIAGAPPAYGLYTAAVSGIVGSAFGSSRHLISGPTNATSLLFAGTIAQYHGPLSVLEVVALHTFIIGVAKLLMGVFRLGRLVNYLSDSVIIGFISGAGILIAVNQVKHCLGVTPALNGDTPWHTLTHLIPELPHTNYPSLAVALCTVGLIYVLRRVHPRMPAALLAMAVAGAAAYFLALGERGVRLVGDIAPIPRTLPPPELLPFSLDAALQLLPGAFAVALIGLMEAISVSKSVAVKSGQQIDADREFMAQGLAGMVGAFFGCFASSGSLTRTWLNYESGATSRVAGVLSGVIVILSLLLFAPLGEYVPVPALAGLLMMVALQMVDLRRIRMALRAGRDTAFVVSATLCAALMLRVDYAIYVGVSLSLLAFIWRTGSLQVSVIVPVEDHRFREVPFDHLERIAPEEDVVILNVVGPMYFAALDRFQRCADRILAQRPRALALRMRRVTSIDSAGLDAIKALHDRLEEAHIPLVLCGVDPEVLRVLRRAGVARTIGEDHIVASKELVLNSLEKALELAENLAGLQEEKDHRARE